MFESYLTRWSLTADGEPIVTQSSRLLPVRQNGVPAMLKVAVEPEEKWGGFLMVWWNGEGAARVLAYEGDALLLERADDNEALAQLAKASETEDDEASLIICTVAANLHAPRNEHPPELVPLSRWFQELEPAAARYGGVLVESAAMARELLSEPQDVAILHGDLHHGNVLDFGSRGWLAIDPKRLAGERAFDFANIFCNPNEEQALRPGRMERQSYVVAEAAGLDRTRLLKWILAYAGLSAAWYGGEMTQRDLAVAEVAASVLAKA